VTDESSAVVEINAGQGRRRVGPALHWSRERWAAPPRSTCACGSVGEGGCTDDVRGRPVPETGTPSVFSWMTCGPSFYVGPSVCVSTLGGVS
jgi:hypothetical protein